MVRMLKPIPSLLALALTFCVASIAAACPCGTCHCKGGCACGDPVVDALLNPAPPQPPPLVLTGSDSAITPASASTVDVYVFDAEFSTDSTGSTLADPVIHVGDSVVWHWVSGVHSVTSVSGIPESFNSGDRFGGPDFPHTFTHAGTFDYFCDIHGFDNGDTTAGGMSGQVTVLAVPEPFSLSVLIVPTLVMLRFAKPPRRKAQG
jgi:plastocyanin